MNSVVNKAEGFSSLLKPFLLTKRNKITIEAVDAAFHRITNLTRLEKELAHWNRREEELNGGDKNYFCNMSIYTSKSFVDAYYGHMGGICLSAAPREMLSENLINLRLADNDKSRLTGMALLAYNDTPCSDLNLKSYWFAFAINPLHSFLSKLSNNHQMELYQQFKIVFQKIADRTQKAVLLPGIKSWGIISNEISFADMIIAYEASLASVNEKTDNARGYALYEDEDAFRHAIVICRPKR